MSAAVHGVAKSQAQLNDSTQYENDLARDNFTKGVSKLNRECRSPAWVSVWPAFGPRYLAAAFISW